MSVSESPNSSTSREEAFTTLYHLEKLFEWITKDRLYTPLRTMDMIVYFSKKAKENPDADLLEEAQTFISEYSRTDDLFSAVDKAVDKSDEFEKIINSLEGRRVSDIAVLIEKESLANTVQQFQQHVTARLGKVLKIKEVKPKNIFEKVAPRGVKTIRNDNKK